MPAVRRRTSRGQGGLGLLEVVVAAALTAIVLGLAMPQYLGYLARRELQNAAFLIQGDLRLAQQTAIAQSGEGPRVEICFRQDSQGYEVYRVAFRSAAARDPSDVLRGPTVKAAAAGQEYRSGIEVALPSGGIRCLGDEDNAARTALAFSGSGAPLPDDGVQRQVRLSLRGQSVFVDVEPGTGLATVRR